MPSTTTATGIPAHAFADPFTRRLLGRTASTTAQLEERLGTRLRLRLIDQRLVVPDPPALEAHLVRRTELWTPEGLVVSRNLVLGRLPEQQELTEIVTGLTEPLGRALAAHGITEHRTPLGVSLSRWPDGTTAVRRRYLLRIGQEAPLYVLELFNPAVVPATPADSTPDDTTPADTTPADTSRWAA